MEGAQECSETGQVKPGPYVSSNAVGTRIRTKLIRDDRHSGGGL